MAARFDDDTFTKIKIIAYLYDPKNGAVSSGATCQIKIHKVSAPNWDDVLVTTISGTVQPNNYFYAEPTTSLLSVFDFSGGDTMMIEATVTRLGISYRDRIYVNHLGVYESIIKLKKDVEFLDITKQDE